MKLFLDSANVQQISEINELGIISGVTTNPTLIAKEGKEHFDQLKRIRKILDDDAYIFAQVTAKTSEEMIKEGRKIAELSKNMIVKIPMCQEGIKAVGKLNKFGIRTAVTLVFSPAQALFCAEAGATIIAPFVGRLDDIGTNGLDVVDSICKVYRAQNIDTKVLVGSLKQPYHVMQSAISGADYLTIPYNVYALCLNHPLSEQGMFLFDQDFHKLQELL